MNKARVKSMKKFWLVLSLAMFCLIVGSLWEFSLNDWSADKKIFLFHFLISFLKKLSVSALLQNYSVSRTVPLL